MTELNELDQSIKDHYEQLSCSNVMKVPYDMRCEFVKKTKECQRFGFINYIMYLECGSKNSRVEEILSCAGFVILFVFLLLSVAIVADQFWSPALKAMAKKMRMSEHLAGVTLLAFGNSVSDILCNMKSNPMASIFTFMMANAILVTLISGGIICFLWPTQLPKYETVRTLLFFTLGTMLTEYYFLSNLEFSVKESLGIIFVYIVYLCIEIIEGYLERSGKRVLVILESRDRHSFSRTTVARRVTIASISSKGKERSTVNTHATRFVDYRITNPKNENLFQDLVEYIQPIAQDYWRECGYTFRFGLIIFSPLMLFFLLLIPMVNLERRRHGWSKLLNCVQIVITPLYSSMIMFRSTSSMLYYQLCITVPLAIFIFQNSRTDIPPSYHFGFVILSSFGCIMMLYACAIEMDELLKICGLILGLSDGFIAATISCWGASICTIVTNVILAQHGYAAMAIAGSYAGPFCSFIIAMGAVPISRHLTNTYEVSECSYYLVAYIFLMISLSSSLIWSLLFNFYGRRSVGVFNFMIYCLYIIYCVLCEIEFIHSFAIDNVIDVI